MTPAPADTGLHHDAAGDHHHGPTTIKPYLTVFALLCAFTAVSFVFNTLANKGTISAQTSFVVILGVAFVKALLVCAIFMHLKWDWSRLYFMIVPALVLAPFMMFALLPDIVLYWSKVAPPFTTR